MERLPEKIRAARKKIGMKQGELADAIGVTQRSLTNYERGCAIPRQSTLRKLSSVLGVTVEYLTNDDIDDPDAYRATEEQIEIARSKFGSKGAREANELLRRNAALFAGGTLAQEEKDAFFEALMMAYVTAKTIARDKFTPKSLQSPEKKHRTRKKKDSDEQVAADLQATDEKAPEEQPLTDEPNVNQ